MLAVTASAGCDEEDSPLARDALQYVFASIIEAWRDGYVQRVAEVTRFTPEQVKAYFDRMIANILDPKEYAVWMVPVVSARVP